MCVWWSNSFKLCLLQVRTKLLWLNWHSGICNWASEASPTLGCSIEISRDIYIISYFTSKSGIWLVISRVASYFHEPEASANTAYE